MCKHVCQTVPWMAWPQAGNKTGLLSHAWLCHWTHDKPSISKHFSSESSLFFKKNILRQGLNMYPSYLESKILLASVSQV